MSAGDLDRLKEVRDLLTDERMLRCSFYAEIMECRDSNAVRAQTERVVEVTRIWRESWILAPLDELIAKYERQLERREAARR